jgi:hypothetical protein
MEEAVNDPNQFAARYVAVWNEPDPGLRSKTIAEIFSAIRQRRHDDLLSRSDGL